MMSAVALLMLAFCAVARAQRIAVVGAGVAGASAAHHVRKSLPDCAIDVFERDRVGGRAYEFVYDGVTSELGASIVWHKNWLVKELGETVAGLERERPAGGRLAFFDGQELVWQESTWRIITLLRLVLRYGFEPLYRISRAPGSAFAKFEGIYDLGNTTFERPEELLKAVGLYSLTQASLAEWISETFGTSMNLVASELIAGVNAANYGQTNRQLNALVGLISLMPAVDPGVYRFKGGNSQLPKRVLELANVTLELGSAVQAVERLPDGKLRLTVQPGHAGGEGCAAGAQPPACDYDAVIVAAPLEGSGLTFKSIRLPTIPARTFRQTTTTIVKGAVRPSYFGLSEMTPGTVLVTEAARLPWRSLSLVGHAASDNSSMWKLFSTDTLPNAWLEMMFELGYKVVVSKTWDTPGAYPSFDPPEDFAKFVLADGLYYAGALETAASAMEIAAISGRLTASLVVQHVRTAAAAAVAAQQACGNDVLRQAARETAAATAA